MEKTAFFTHDRQFYKRLFGMLVVLALQNLVAYSVNMADNMMLGSYRQDALSGAATVNQIFFMVQQFALSAGNALVAIAAQYWGEKRVVPIRKLTKAAMAVAVIIGLIFVLVCSVLPEAVLRIFTDSPEIISQGLAYLKLLKWTFLLYMLTNVLMAALRSVGTVSISFYISAISLVVNCGINYVLIFGRFGMPRMGISGAAIGTLIARVLELLIVLWYMLFKDRKLCLFKTDKNDTGNSLMADYIRVWFPIMLTQILWGVSVPMQTAILGHLSSDAIAANSVATTFYQYLKVIVVAMSSVSAVMVGNAIGRGEEDRIRSDARSMAVIDVAVGIMLALALLALRKPLLSFYSLTDSAMVMADHLIIVMSIVMVGMSYQFPVSFGIIQGAGDTGFTMKMNLISTWLIVMPLSFAAAFWWHLPVVLVVLVIQSDQIFKGIPTFIRFRSYNWIRKLTK